MGGNPVIRQGQFTTALPGVLAFVLVELGLYLTYFAHEARFHWFTHFFVGGTAAFLVMTVLARRFRRPVPMPLLWLLLGHLLAMFPDFLFQAGIAHQRWMDVFLGHLSSHFIPGRNWTWYAIWLVCMAVYLLSVASAARDFHAANPARS